MMIVDRQSDAVPDKLTAPGTYEAIRKSCPGAFHMCHMCLNHKATTLTSHTN